MWRTWMLVVLVGCGGGESAPDPDGQPSEPFETPQFLPLICTSGPPDTPNAPNPSCPVNQIPLDTLAVAGAEVGFTVAQVATGLVFDHIAITAGPAGLHFEQPKFLVAGEAAGDPYANISISLAAGETATLDASTAVVEDTTARIAVRFEVLAPFP